MPDPSKSFSRRSHQRRTCVTERTLKFQNFIGRKLLLECRSLAMSRNRRSSGDRISTRYGQLENNRCFTVPSIKYVAKGSAGFLYKFTVVSGRSSSQNSKHRHLLRCVGRRNNVGTRLYAKRNWLFGGNIRKKKKKKMLSDKIIALFVI